MDETWVPIDAFPTYEISDLGRVCNRDTGRIMKLFLNQSDTVMVGMRLGGVQHTRSVKVLVAEAFVEGRTEIFNTPMHLDGNHLNCQARNLVWRPRWFVWKYADNFRVANKELAAFGPISDEMGVVYKTVLDAATTHGVLCSDIRDSMFTGKEVFPDWKRFYAPK